MKFWSARCFECGYVVDSGLQMTVDEARKWANEWEKKHRKEMHDDDTVEETGEAGS